MNSTGTPQQWYPYDLNLHNDNNSNSNKQDDVYVALIMAIHYKSLPSSFDECTVSVIQT